MMEMEASVDGAASHTELMERAVGVAKDGIAAGQSPFGAVIATKEGAIVSAAHNKVRAQCDATAHAEVVAIREACTKLGTVDLGGHVIATTCEPCPMCAAAIHWARIDSVIYGAAIADARRAHFNELSVSAKVLYEQGASTVRIYPRVLREQCMELFDMWKQGPNPRPY